MILKGYTLDGHVSQLKFSNANTTGAASNKSEKKPETTKLMVRNIPFEATKKDLQELFGYVIYIRDILFSFHFILNINININIIKN